MSFQARGVYIVAPYRSAVGKAKRGSLAHKRPDDLCSDVIRGVVERSGVPQELIEDVVVGCAMPEAEQGMNVARVATLLAGLPESVPGVTVNRFCASGIQSIAMAGDRVAAGHGECFLAGGTESMSMVPMMGHKPVGSTKIYSESPEIYMGMGLTAEEVARKYNISRESQDEFALQSHQRALAAQKEGHFENEILPVEVERKIRGDNPGEILTKTITFDTDEGPRPDTSLEGLARLRAVFLKGGTVSAGTSSQMSDGAGMCLVCSEDFVTRHNLKPQARLMSYAVAGVPPAVMGIGPVKALPKALAQAGLKLGDIEHFELNEAFAAQSLAVIRELDLDGERVNPSGGAIALGHPLGATGARLTATLLHGLARKKQKYGTVTMCIGTGMGAAAVFESLAA